MRTADAIDMVGQAIRDARQIRNGELTAEFTEDDAKVSIRELLRTLMDSTSREPSDEDIADVLDY